MRLYTVYIGGNMDGLRNSLMLRRIGSVEQDLAVIGLEFTLCSITVCTLQSTILAEATIPTTGGNQFCEHL